MKIINLIFKCMSKCLGLAFIVLFSFVACTTLNAATASVNNIGDAPAANPAVAPDSTLGVGVITLRSSIQYLNTQVQPTNTIDFNISGSGPFVIQPATDLDSIAVPVTIDGYTQPGTSVNTLAQGDNAVLLIVINGSNYTVGDGLTTGNGLHFVAGSDGSVVRGLVINQWLDNGVLVDSAAASITGISIVGNFIGTDPSGTTQMANRIGVGLSGFVNPCINTIIGTTAFADRNIISGSFGWWVTDSYNEYGGCIASSYNQGTTIQNNYIGTDISGTVALGNSHAGVGFYGESSSLVGGAAASERNIISGNYLFGVGFVFGTTACVAQGNYVGTDVTGTIAVGNGYAGVSLWGYFASTTGNTIIANLISGNVNGIFMGSASWQFANNNTIQGNLIGTDFSGTKALPNTGYGIVLNDAQNTVGGITPQSRNIVSGNGKGGILLYASSTSESLVENNYIGTDISGTRSLPNQGNGIQIGLIGGLGGAPGNIIGG